jgi:hypothetical protein
VSDDKAWLPPPPDDLDAAYKKEYWTEWIKSRLEVDKQRDLDDLVQRDRDLATDDYLERKLHETLWAETTASVTRLKDAAKWIETAAAGLAALYATALGITFSIADNPLPARGFISPLFFGLAVGTAAIYLAYVSSGPGPARPAYGSSAAERNWEKTKYFSQYGLAEVKLRGGWLRAAVLALLIGVFFMPAPYVDLTPLATVQPPPQGSALADLPAPPSGNVDAQTAWYTRTLDRFEEHEKTAPAQLVFMLNDKQFVPFDLALGILALIAWAIASLLGWFFLQRGSDPSSGTRIFSRRR